MLVPAYSWPQIASAAKALGYRVRYIDVDSEGRLSLAGLDKTLGPSIGAIVVCHLFGNPSLASSIVESADRFGIPVIEDCSQALFARDKGRPVGTWGAFGLCSTGAHKFLSTGEGGLLWTNRPDLYARAYALTQHSERHAAGWLRDRVLVNSLSLRMHPLAAKAGLRSLSTLQERLLRNSARCETIRSALASRLGVPVPQVHAGCKALWQHCPVLPQSEAAYRLAHYESEHLPAYLLMGKPLCPNAQAFSQRVMFIDVQREAVNELLE